MGCATTPATCCIGLRGNIDGSWDDPANVSDIIFLIEYVYFDGPVPNCSEEADPSGDGSIDITDITALVDYFFKDGPPPVDCP